ncbi:hypothetical protein HYH02_012888 [Chlamydomonas schloesseri]|uniref:Agmatine deiminase n=1 Tax=Chlamydomonas schloesseri TaxID=2026947 RepID=A0A835T6W5_9CHLO|nr:hypothetical protein HYH02_012888 [Chlamydomonas schloesseri]|eukprot:KAG2432755.1 hypothetical protein HYH02_012888 [Chlamydomonas schloesseri]
MAASAQLLRQLARSAAPLCLERGPPGPWPCMAAHRDSAGPTSSLSTTSTDANNAGSVVATAVPQSSPAATAIAQGCSSSGAAGPARARRSTSCLAGSASEDRIPLATDWLGSGTPSGGGSSNTTDGSSSSSAGGARDTPKARGFRMPGEWEPHAGTWMAFPHDCHLWRAGGRPAQKQLADVARAVSQFEQVWMLVDPRVRAEARAALRGVSGVELVEMRVNDVWTRDWGPTCLVRDLPGSSSDGSSGGGSSGRVRRRREVGALHFDYNCYGAPLKPYPLMPDWSLDRAAGRALPALAGVRAEAVWRAPRGLHLEGGAVLSDGEGTLLVTEECLLHPSRNLPPAGWRQQGPLASAGWGPEAAAAAAATGSGGPGAAAAAAAEAAAAALAAASGGERGAATGQQQQQLQLPAELERRQRKAEIGALLCDWLGADKVLWVPHGMAGDEEGTNGHVDNAAAFAAPGLVLLAWCDDPDQDPDQTRRAAENLAALADQTDARGRPIRVVPVPCPLPLVKVSGEEAGGAAERAAAVAAGYGGRLSAGARLPASYINHYIVNGAVIVPLFGGEQAA